MDSIAGRRRRCAGLQRHLCHGADCNSPAAAPSESTRRLYSLAVGCKRSQARVGCVVPGGRVAAYVGGDLAGLWCSNRGCRAGTHVMGAQEVNCTTRSQRSPPSRDAGALGRHVKRVGDQSWSGCCQLSKRPPSVGTRQAEPRNNFSACWIAARDVPSATPPLRQVLCPVTLSDVS